MDWIIGLIALTAMEIVLGIDNIIFIIILTGRLPEDQQRTARKVGLGAALGTRILLLLTLSTVMQLTHPVVDLRHVGIPSSWLPPEVHEISWRDIIMLVGGLFLIAKSVHEIHARVEGFGHEGPDAKTAKFGAVIIQIAVLDLVFSLDSVITAVGMVSHIWVMVTAVICAVTVMLFASDYIAHFVERHPTVKMLALSFLILIGFMLVAEGLGTHIEKGYVYFAMAFSIGVEMLNIYVGSKVHLPTPKK